MSCIMLLMLENNGAVTNAPWTWLNLNLTKPKVEMAIVVVNQLVVVGELSYNRKLIEAIIVMLHEFLISVNI